jgi:ABC-2 type transport system permease protein
VKGILLVTWKEFIHIARDRIGLFVMVAFPAITLMLYGYALNFDVKNVRLGVCDLDKTKESRAFVRSFLAHDYFVLVEDLQSAEEVEKALSQGEIAVGIVIPKDFGRAVQTGKEIAVQALIDGANAQSANTVLGYIKGFTLNFVARKIQEKLEATGLRIGQGGMDLRMLMYYNPTLETARFLVPGLMGIVLTVMAVVATALSLVREKERGTMTMLKMLPFRAYQIVIGKTLPYLLFSLFAAGLVLVASKVLFGVEVKGSLLLLFSMLLVYLFGALALGVFISSLTESAQVAFTIGVTMTMLPSFILSGFVFPLESMPWAVRAVSYIVPARYIIAIIRAIMLKGEGLQTFMFEFLWLVGFAIAMTLFASIRVRKTLAG